MGLGAQFALQQLQAADDRSGVKTGKSRREQLFSDLPPEADLTADIVEVSQAPKTISPTDFIRDCTSPL
jgi:hypothetical protein